MAWDADTNFINMWISELEALFYELKLPAHVLEETRRLLTKAVDEGFSGPGHSGVYVALSCLYLACRVNAVMLQLERLLTSPLGYGLKGERLVVNVRAIQARLALRICPNCGVERDSGRRFCSKCGTWLAPNVISKREEEKCLRFE